MDEMMESGLKIFKAVTNMISSNKLGITIFDGEGNIMARQILSQIGIGEVGSNIRELRLTGGSTENLQEDLKLEGEVLEIAANKFTVAAQLLFSEFDMIHSNINFLHWQFDNDRISKIRTAEDCYQAYLTDLKAENMDNLQGILIQSRKDVEDSFNALEEVIKKNIESILAVPTKRHIRLFQSNPKVVKAYEDNARNALHNYLRALSIIVKMNSILNFPDDSKRKIDRAIEFLLSFTDKQLERVEGWNADPDSDGFWINQMDQGLGYGDMLEELNSIRNRLINESFFSIEMRG